MSNQISFKTTMDIYFKSIAQQKAIAKIAKQSKKLQPKTMDEAVKQLRYRAYKLGITIY